MFEKDCTETFDSLLEEYFFEDAFIIKTGIYPSYFSLWMDEYIPQLPEHADTLELKRSIRKVSNHASR